MCDEEIACSEESEEYKDCFYGKNCRVICRKTGYGTTSGIELMLTLLLSVILLFLATVVVTYYLTKEYGGFAWREYDSSKGQREASINTHALMETIGFITIGGMGEETWLSHKQLQQQQLALRTSHPTFKLNSTKYNKSVFTAGLQPDQRRWKIAIVMFGISKCCSRPSMKMLHQFLFLLSAVIIIVGLWIAMEYKDHSNVPHFTTAHSWLGIASICLFGTVFAFGILKFIILLAFGPLACCLRTSCKSIHAALGLIAYWVAISASIVAVTRQLVESQRKRSKYETLEAVEESAKVAQNTFQSFGDILLNAIKYLTGQDRTSQPIRTVSESSDLGPRRDVHLENAAILIFVFCGILITYSVISRVWRNT